MPSYIHNNKKYSVVALKDGRAMEVRRGTVTFNHRNKEDRKHWDSVDAWTASWPAGATPCNSSTPTTATRDPIIQRYFRGLPSSVITSPSKAKLDDYAARIAHAEENMKHLKACKYEYPSHERAAKSNIAYYTKKLQEHTAFLRGEYVYLPTYIHKTKIYVSHNGSLHPVYHNKKENTVFVRMYDPDTQGDSMSYTAASLGITVDSKFFKRSDYDDVFVPLSA